MTRGLYISAIGMKAQMNKMDIVANNLANVDTTGFKRDSVAFRSFDEELTLKIHDTQSQAQPNAAPRSYSPHESPIGELTSGVLVDEVFTDFSNGRLREVNDPYTMAIGGGGFFTVQVRLATGEVAERYTRDGNFMIDGRGYLMTKDGGYVLGQNGPVVIPTENGAATIDAQGNIISGGNIIETLRITDFTDYTTLRKTGDNYYDITAQSAQAAFTGTVVQGYAEDSNINSVKELVEMINLSRIYEANQRFITVMDQTLGKAVNEVGRK